MKRRNDRFGMKGVARLLLAFLCASVAGRAFAVDLISNLIRCAPGMTPYVVLNGEERTSGKFYGYVNGGSGPGDSAFKDAKAWADEHHTPLVVVFDNGSGNTFTADLNDDEDYQGGRYLLQWMNGKAGPDNYNCLFTYFKGGTTGPAACKDAYDFCKQYGAGTLFPLVVCYWKWHDGTIKTSVTSSLSSVGSFKGPVDSFIAKNKPPPYTPPKSSVDFAVKDGELRATPDTPQVYVPMVRTNNTDAVGSKYGLEVTYPDATTANITFTADTVGEIKLEKVATAGKWADGKSIQLVLFNTNKVAVATNHITCVATPANSAGFPYLPGKVDSLEVGEWSMDVGFIGTSVTNVEALRAVVAGATEEYASATNALATAEAISNTTYGVYIAASNALEAAIIAYDDATNYLYYAGVTNATATEAYEAATIALAEAIAAYDLATNALYYAGVTNATATEAYEAATTALAGAQSGFLDASNTLYYAESTNATATAAYEAAMAALAGAQSGFLDASNTLYYAESTNATATAAYEAATNALAAAVTAYDDATNYLYYAESTNATATVAYEAATTALLDAQGEYVAASNELANAESGTPAYQAAEQRYINATNALYYAESTNATATAAYEAATNALAGAQSGFLDASNTLYYAESTNATATAAYEAATAALAAAVAAYDDATNYLYYAGVTNATATTVYVDATNALAAAVAAYDDATNYLYYAESTNATATAAYEAATTALAGAQSGFLDASNTLYYAESTNATATTAYIDATNALAGAIVAYDDAMNYLYYAGVTNEVAAATYAGAVQDLDEKQSTAETKTGELEDAVADCEAAEADFFVVFSGSFVANDEMDGVAAFLGSNEYREWALSNKVRNIVLDCPEDAESWKGASLFSYATATNGKSGAYFISINGLSPAEAQNYSEEMQVAFMLYRADRDTPGAPEVLLVRADGTEAGSLSLYRDGSGYDVKENIARLNELVANAADKTEAMNDYLIGEELPVFVFGGETNGVGSLSVNDTIDWFQVTGLQAKKAITFDIAKDPGAPSISFVLATGDGVEIPMSVSNVWVLTDEQVASDVYVGVGAYADVASATTKFNGKSMFSYTVSAKDAPDNPGKIGFTTTADTVTEGQWEDSKPGKPGTSTEYVFKVARTEGLNGRVQAKVSLDMSEEEYAAIHGRFEWTDQVLAWDDLEAGEKDVVITLKNDDACYDASNIVFKVEITGGAATVENGKGGFTLTLEEEDPATYGSLEISNVLLPVAGDGRMYVRSGEAVELTVSRAGGSNGSARGTVIAKLAGKSFETNEYEWAAMETGIKTNMFEIPAVTAAKTEVLFSLTSSIGKGRDSVKVFALASDAPEFEAKAVDWTGIQYTTTETNLVALSAFTGMTLKGLNKISGTVPSGLKVAIVDGELVVTGTPTVGAETTATFWVTLTRDDGGTLYSMPVTVTFKSEALADVNPGFTSARSWTGLPVMNMAGDHLVGLLDMAVSKNGKTSARYRMAGGKTVSFSSPGLAGIDDERNVALYAMKTNKVNGVAKKYELFATLGSNGSLAATIACDNVDIGEMSIQAGTVPWSAERTAQAFGGNYVAAFPLVDPVNAHSNTLCFGATSMRLKCNSESAWRAGKVTFAGTLPNGKVVSGTATLVPTKADAASASLPVFASSSADTFSAMVDLNGAQLAAADGIVPFWRHDESGIESLSYENDVSVIGTVWSWADWLECFGGKFDAKTAFGLSFNLNRTSGIAAGTMRLDVGGTGRQSTLSWKGVALPGAEPSIRGAYWYNVSKPYTDANGNDRKRTVKAGDAVGLAIE